MGRNSSEDPSPGLSRRSTDSRLKSRSSRKRIVGKERVDAVRPEIQRFVRDNPIRDLSFGRRSAGLHASAVTAAAWGTDVVSSVAQIDETARDLSDRLTIYAEQLPQIARWQGEILLLQSQREVLTKPFANLDGIDRQYRWHRQEARHNRRELWGRHGICHRHTRAHRCRANPSAGSARARARDGPL